MQSCESEPLQRLASCGDETLPSPVSNAPVSAEYERGMVNARLRTLEEENMRLLERVIALEEINKLRNSSRPPEFEVQAKGIRIRGKQIVGVVMSIAGAGVTIAYFFFRNR
jgi:hypothetical protein